MQTSKTNLPSQHPTKEPRQDYHPPPEGKHERKIHWLHHRPCLDWAGQENEG